MSAFADRLRARLAARLAEEASTAEASGTGARASARAPEPPRKRRERSARAILAEDVRILNRAVEGGAFADVVETYFAELRACQSKRERRATKNARLGRYEAGLGRRAKEILGRDVAGRIVSTWSSKHHRPLFRRAKGESK